MGAILDDLIGNSRHAYFIGIGGVGMSALARVLKYRGLEVSGSDMKETASTRSLINEGIHVYLGQNQIHFDTVDLVVYSSAIQSSHLELAVARKQGLKVYHRAEILSSLFNHAQTSIAVTGTHGKTTTSSMISFVLSELGKNPTCLVGGDVLNLGTNTILGGSDLWVSEVDESDKSHELYAPTYAIMTNLEEDHLDNYRDLKDLEESFARFLTNLRNPGAAIYSADDPVLKHLIFESGKPAISFGLTPQADFYADNIRFNAFGSEFDFYETGFFSARVKLSVPGFHNIANALAAMTLMIQLGIEPETIIEPLSRFQGARRRLEIKWKSEEMIVIDDYAHHPTEVRASIQALSEMGRRLIVVFQPHRFSRTQHFFKEFGHAFDHADEVILTDIYGAGEANPNGIGVDVIYQQVAKSGHPSVRIVPKKEITSYLLGHSNASAIVAFLGAGDIGEVADEFANRFKSLTTA